MALTPNLATVTIAGTYVDIEGNPIAGQVKFTPRAIIKDTSANQVIIPRVISATLDATGSFSVVIPATNDADVTPINFTYGVEEAFTGGRTFDIAVPAGSGTINLADVAPTVSSSGTEAATYVLLSAFTTLSNTVTTIQAVTDAVLTSVNEIEAAAAAAVAAASDLDLIEKKFINPLMLMGV